MSSGVMHEATRALEACLLTAPVPQIVPASLASFVIADREEQTGRLLDWKLGVAEIPDGRLRSLLDELAAFRRCYSERAVVGDLTRFRQMIAWGVTQGLPVDGLRSLCQHDVVVDPVTCYRASLQLAALGDALRAIRPPAVGWHRAGGVGLTGGVVSDELSAEHGMVVLESGGVRVHAFLDCLQVRSRPLTFAGEEPSRALTVRGWSLLPSGEVDVDGVVVDEAVGRALMLLAPGTVDVHVAAVPATSVFAGLLTHLGELCQQAARTARPLRMRG